MECARIAGNFTPEEGTYEHFLRGLSHEKFLAYIRKLIEEHRSLRVTMVGRHHREYPEDPCHRRNVVAEIILRLHGFTPLRLRNMNFDHRLEALWFLGETREDSPWEVATRNDSEMPSFIRNIDKVIDELKGDLLAWAGRRKKEIARIQQKGLKHDMAVRALCRIDPNQEQDKLKQVRYTEILCLLHQEGFPRDQDLGEIGVSPGRCWKHEFRVVVDTLLFAKHTE